MTLTALAEEKRAKESLEPTKFRNHKDKETKKGQSLRSEEK
jgi:hypothetical protein